MWRILGLIFYGNKDAFLRDKKAFSEEKAKAFCREKGIGIGDTAMEVIRLKANASDKFLEVVRPIDPEKVLSQIPECVAIVVTGRKRWIPSSPYCPARRSRKWASRRNFLVWEGR